MNENQLEFFELLDRMHYKMMCFFHNPPKRSSSDKYAAFDLPATFEMMEKEISNELSAISKIFYIPERSALVLGIVIYLYLKYDGVKTNFITFGDIERFFYMETEISLLLKLRESIFELEERNYIEINEAEFYLVRVFNRNDRRENDYYMLPTKPSFVPFANQKFELSQSTINKLNNL